MYSDAAAYQYSAAVTYGLADAEKRGFGMFLAQNVPRVEAMCAVAFGFGVEASRSLQMRKQELAEI